jgi:D-alanyl-lipoteichoic acid acyltransferase DltB (MBOAT superfamily)
MATMVLGGLWHGAAWNFVLWGFYQGALLAIHRLLAGRLPAVGGSASRGPLSVLRRVLGIVLFFQIVCYGWLLFRATSLAQIIDFTEALFHLDPAQFLQISVPAPPIAATAGLLVVLVWDVMIEATRQPRFYAAWPAPLRAGLYAGLLYLLAFGGATGSTAFIYFQF